MIVDQTRRLYSPVPSDSSQKWLLKELLEEWLARASVKKHFLVTGRNDEFIELYSTENLSPWRVQLGHPMLLILGLHQPLWLQTNLDALVHALALEVPQGHLRCSRHQHCHLHGANLWFCSCWFTKALPCPADPNPSAHRCIPRLESVGATFLTFPSLALAPGISDSWALPLQFCHLFCLSFLRVRQTCAQTEKL